MFVFKRGLDPIPEVALQIKKCLRNGRDIILLLLRTTKTQSKMQGGLRERVGKGAHTKRRAKRGG